jgi:hypothetical protein
MLATQPLDLALLTFDLVDQSPIRSAVRPSVNVGVSIATPARSRLEQTG